MSRVGTVHRWLPVAAAIAVLLLIVGGLVFMPWPALALGRPLRAPDSLAGLPLTIRVTGPEAVGQIRQLHRGSLSLTDGLIAHYHAGPHMVMLWIGRSGNPLKARLQEVAMTRRIAGAETPFTPTGRRDLSGHRVYALSGMGDQHYYFRQDDLIYWLQVEPTLAEPALNDLLATLH